MVFTVDNVAMALDSGDVGKLLKKKEEHIKEIEKCDILISRGAWLTWIEKIKRFYFTKSLTWIQKDIAANMRKKAYRCTGDAFISKFQI